MMTAETECMTILFSGRRERSTRYGSIESRCVARYDKSETRRVVRANRSPDGRWDEGQTEVDPDAGICTVSWSLVWAPVVNRRVRQCVRGISLLQQQSTVCAMVYMWGREGYERNCIETKSALAGDVEVRSVQCSMEWEWECRVELVVPVNLTIIPVYDFWYWLGCSRTVATEE